MAEWKDLVRLKNFKRVFNTSWSHKVVISGFSGNAEDAYQGEVNAVVSVNDMTDDNGRANKEDLTKFLSSSFSKFIASDRVRQYNRSDYPKFISGWETFVDNPIFDGELDMLRSKMIEKRIAYKTKEELLEINTYLLKKGMRPLLDIKGETTIRGQRYFMFEVGRVPNR